MNDDPTPEEDDRNQRETSQMLAAMVQACLVSKGISSDRVFGGVWVAPAGEGGYVVECRTAGGSGFQVDLSTAEVLDKAWLMAPDQFQAYMIDQIDKEIDKWMGGGGAHAVILDNFLKGVSYSSCNASAEDDRKYELLAAEVQDALAGHLFRHDCRLLECRVSHSDGKIGISFDWSNEAGCRGGLDERVEVDASSDPGHGTIKEVIRSAVCAAVHPKDGIGTKH